MEHPDLTFCRTRLREPGTSPSTIAKDTGLSKRWIEYIRDGAIDNPGLKNVSVLKAYLRRKRKKVAEQAAQHQVADAAVQP